MDLIEFSDTIDRLVKKQEEHEKLIYLMLLQHEVIVEKEWIEADGELKDAWLKQLNVINEVKQAYEYLSPQDKKKAEKVQD